MADLMGNAADLMGNATPMLDDMSLNNSNVTEIDLPKTVSLIFIFVFSLIGNVCTVAVVSQFKQHKLPDVLVIGLACTDLIATFIPVPMSLYSYIHSNNLQKAALLVMRLEQWLSSPDMLLP